jgi:hypothetical protein
MIPAGSIPGTQSSHFAKGKKMREIVKTVVAVIAAAACVNVAGAEDRPEMVLLLAKTIVAMGVAVFVAGIVTRARWQAILACVWLVVTAGWLVAAFDGIGARYVLEESNLHSCILMTMCSVVFLAASLVVVKPCVQFGARLRCRPSAETISAGVQAQRA